MPLKPIAKISADTYNRIPDDFPQLSAELQAKNPELKKFQEDLDDWYRELKLALKANFDLTK